MNTSRIDARPIIRATLSLAIVAITCVGLAGATAGPVKEGDPFPDLKSVKLEGTLPDLAGKVVIVDFFASWCGPCKDSFPVMQELHEKFEARGLVILAVNLDKKAEDMKSFLAAHPVTFPAVRDGTSTLVKQVQIATMPSSFILDKAGKVRFVHRGFKGDKTREEYLKQIAELLN